MDPLIQTLLAFNTLLSFLLFAILFRMIVFLLPKKIYEIIMFAGNLVRLPIKRLFLWFYNVEVMEYKWEESTLTIEKCDNFDCLMTSIIIGPFVALFSLAYLFFDVHQRLDSMDIKFTWFNLNIEFLAWILLIFSIIIVVTAVPSSKEIKAVLNTTKSSLFLWCVKALVAIISTYISYSYNTGVVSPPTVFLPVLLLLIPIYRHDSDSKAIIFGKNTSSDEILEGDIFG